MRNVIVSPSILALGPDENKIVEGINEISKNGAGWVHVDIMDGVFVTNKTFGPEVLKDISSKHTLINDVHIMVINPKDVAKKYCDAGADILTFHLEACENSDDVIETIQIIKNEGVKVGISIKPETPIEAVLPFVKFVDLVLIMSVEPGKGRQTFMPASLARIKKLREYIDTNNFDVLIEVDGGINEKTAKSCKENGVDVLVAGSFVFENNIKESIERLLK